jgi:hypothetical protein
MFPKIRFKIDPIKDIQSFFIFLEEAKYDGGRNFDWAVLRHYPYFNKFKTGTDFSVSKKTVEDYVNAYYFKNREQVEKNFYIFENNWKKKENAFFKLVNNLFLNTNWPKGKYIAYATMWGMYPRFIESKTFQIPGIVKNKKSVSLIIAHEMLHFIFFAYFLNKYKKYKSHKYDFFVWHVSEIFNSVIFRRSEWQELLRVENQDYPEHQQIITKLSGKNYSLADLVDSIILEVEKLID